MYIYEKNIINNILNKPKKGDLYIKFDIIFPTYIDSDKKELITTILNGKNDR